MRNARAGRGFGRARACARLGDLRPRRWSIGCIARRAMPGSPRKPNASPIGATTSRGCVAFCRRERIDFVVVGPGGAARPRARRRARSRGHRRLWAERRGRRTRRLEGLHEGPLRARRHPDRRLPPLSRPGRGQGLHRRARRADRRQGRRACRAARASSSPMISTRPTGRSTPRSSSAGSAQPGRDRRRGFSRRRGGELFRAGRRQGRAAARRGAGPQARRRRRHRPQYRRHGRLFAGARAHPGARGPGHGAHHPADGAAMAREGRPFKGVLYAGLMLTESGAEAARIQCPLRRPGMPGADDAAEERPVAGADRGARRRAEAGRSALARRQPRYAS